MLCFIISFIYSFKLIGNNSIPNYMRGFFYYNFVAIIMMIIYLLSYHFSLFSRIYASRINNFLLIFHFIFLGLFIYRVIIEWVNKKIFFSIFLFELAILISILIYNYSEKTDLISFSYANFALIILCLFYYNYLFKNPPTLNLLKEPSFWVITGVFFCMILHTPISAIFIYIKQTASTQVASALFNIISFAYASMHLFFTKAILCSINHHKR